MTSRMRALGLLGITVLAASCDAGPQPADGSRPDAEEQSTAAFHDRIEGAWFVELSEPPLSRGGARTRLDPEKSLLRAHLSASGLAVRERYSFDRLWNGLSVKITGGSAQRLLAMPGVKAIYPVHRVELDKLERLQRSEVLRPAGELLSSGATPGGGAEEDLFTATAMTGANIAQSTLGFRGDGIRVGIIDTGIDFNHPDLGGCFGPGCRVAFGYDLVGDAYAGTGSGDITPVPDPIPDDNCNGHGTHVAGIVGANGTVLGVAPHVTLGAYRVFGCTGSSSSDVIVKAMEMAEADGMRVINMSLGSAFTWAQGSPEAQAADQLVENGVVVVCSIGNSGATAGGGPVWSVGAPGVANSAIGVASIENTAVAQAAFTLSPDNAKIGYSPATGAPPPLLSGSLPIVKFGTPTSTTDMCNGNPSNPGAGVLTGKAVLIRRGTCAFREKVLNAVAAGASAVVLYNNTAGALAVTVTGTPSITIPVVGITSADGATIDGRIAAGPETLTWTSLTASTANPTGGTISSFSSTGLTDELVLKPDLAAPGGSIWSTFPLELGGYASLSGTSMASPHTAGAVALLLQARPNLSAAQVRDVLQNYAVPAIWPGDKVTPDLVNRQGAGLIHIDVAAQARVTASPGKLSLGESQAGPAKRTITFTNEGATAVTYDASHTPAASQTTQGGTSSAYAPTITAAGFASVSFGAPSVVVPAGGTATLDVTLTADAVIADGAIYGGYLVFTPQGGGSAIRVPYAGYKGDYQALRVLVPTASGYPWLVKGAANQPTGATYTLQNGDVPSLRVHLEHSTRELKIEVFDAVKGKPYGTVIDEEFVPPSSFASAFTPFQWDGTTVFNKSVYKVPNGTYLLKLSVLKDLGTASNPADWETWTSPIVTLDHP